MGRRPCCSNEGVQNKGPWTAEEDKMLADHIKAHGERKWSSIPKETGEIEYYSIEHNHIYISEN